MNKHRYRIVFNAHRGQLMAVAEHASACGKSAAGEREASSGGGPAESAAPVRLPGLRLLTALVLVALGGQIVWMPQAQAQIVAYREAPGSQRPTVLPGAGGVPIVNVQTPSNSGVSRNTYSQFDVQEQGAVLNNSRTGAQTELAGQIQGNPWMAKGTARIIVNEVVSGSPSQLRGMIEVGGDRAEVVIANPAGVDVDGSGFINASRATITTGTPTINGGNLEGYVVRQGTVTVHEGGLDASRSDYTAVIARAVHVNGAVHAQELDVIVGANEVSADHKQVTPIAGTGPAPAFALDVSELGGMYAGKITLIGTEAGVGVRNAGRIVASAGEVVITAEGLVTNTGQIVSQGHANVESRDGVTNTGTLYAKTSVQVTARNRIRNEGMIAAEGSATLSAQGETGEIDSTAGSIIAAGLQDDGSLGQTGELLLSASERVHIGGYTAAPERVEVASAYISARGGSALSPVIELEAVTNPRRQRDRKTIVDAFESDHVVHHNGGGIDLSGAQIQAGVSFAARTGGHIVADDATLVSDLIELTASDLSNQGGRIVQTSGEALRIAVSGFLDNVGGVISTDGDLTLEAMRIDNDGGTLYSGNHLRLSSNGHVDNGHGSISGLQGIQLDTWTLHNAGYVGGSVRVSSNLSNAGTINGSATSYGYLSNSGSILGDASGAHLSNSGTISGSASAGGSLSNSGTITGSASAGGSLSNSGAIGDSAYAGEHLHNSGSIRGEAVSGGDLVNSGVIGGYAHAAHNLSNTGLIDGVAFAGDMLSNFGWILGEAVAGASLHNAGLIEGRAIAGLDLDNSGLIDGTATSGSRLNNSGSIVGTARAAADLINSGHIDGTATAGSDLSNSGWIHGAATATGALANSGGIDGSARAGVTLTNSGTILGSAKSSGSLDNSGYIRDDAEAGGRLDNFGYIGGDATAGTSLSNEGWGYIGGNASAGGGLSNAGTIMGDASGLNLGNTGYIGGNAGGLFGMSNSGYIGGDASGGSGGLDNSGSIGGSASAGGSIGNSGYIGGHAWAGGALGNSGSIGGSAGGAAGLSNSGSIGGDASGGMGGLSNSGSIGGSAHTSGSLSNSGSIAGSASGADIGNSGTIGGAASALAGLSNLGSIGGDASSGGAFDNVGSIGGSVSAGGPVANSGSIGGSLHAEARVSNSGQIGGSVHTPAELINSGAIGTRGGVVGVSASAVINSGSIGGNGSTWISTEVLDNRGGTLRGDSLSVSAQDVLNQGGLIHANEWVVLSATGTVDNRGGRISSDGVTAIIDPLGASDAGAKTLNIINTDGILSAGTHLELDAAGLGFDGSLLSGGSFSLSLVGDRVLDGTGFFQAEGAVSLAFTGHVTNDGALFHSAGLSLSAGSLHNTGNGHIGSDAVTQVRTGEGALTNQGHISGEAVVLSGGDFDNSGGRVTAGTLVAEFGGDLRNDGGRLESTGDAWMRVGGDVSSERGVFASETGNLILQADGDVRLSGSRYQAEQGLAAIVAGGTIEIAAAAQAFERSEQVGGAADTDELGQYRQTYSDEALSHTDLLDRVASGIEHEASQIIGHDVLLEAGENIRIEGSRLAATDSLLLRAEGDIDILAAVGRERVESTHVIETQFGCGGGEACRERTETQRTDRVEERDVLTGSQLQAERIGIVSGGDTRILGSELHAEDSLGIRAGGALTVGAMTYAEQVSTQWQGSGLGQLSEGQSLMQAERHGGSTLSTGSGDMTLVAGGDFILEASVLAAGQHVLVDADNIHLRALTDTVRVDSEGRDGARHNWGQLAFTELSGAGSAEALGNGIGAVGDIVLRARGDLEVAGMQVNSLEGLVGLIASGDIRIGAVGLEHLESIQTYSKSSGLLSSKRTETRSELAQTVHVGSLISGARVGMDAGGSIAIAGSAVVADGDISLRAAERIDIVANTHTSERYHYTDTKKSGLFSGGSFGITLGTQRSTQERSDSIVEQGQATSLIGSRFGSIEVVAGGEVRIAGSDIVTRGADELHAPDEWASAQAAAIAVDPTLADNGRAIRIVGSAVTIDPGTDSHHYSEQHRFSQSGLTLSISNPVVSAVQTIEHVASSASRAGDTRSRMLAGAAGAMAAYNAYNSVQDAAKLANAGAAGQVGGITFNLSLGKSESTYRAEGESHNRFGSNVLAAGNLDIRAQGAGDASNLLVVGSRLSAGGDVSLAADNRIDLLASASNGLDHSDNRSSSASVGIGISFGGSQSGISFNAGASRAKGHSDGAHLAWTNTQVEAGGTLRLESGGDTTLRGAVVSGERVIGHIGGDLTIASLQDTSQYDAQQKSASAGASICLPPICGGASSVNYSASKSQAHGDYVSVTEQSGIHAGDGGFQLYVGGHTQLDGGLITSTQAAIDAGLNRLDTGTLGSTDLANQSSAVAKSSGTELNSAMFTQGKYGFTKGVIANTMLSGEQRGSSEGLALSAMSPAETTVRNTAEQMTLTGQDAATVIARLESHASSSSASAVLFDVENMYQRVQGERAVELGVFATAVPLFDEAYRSRMMPDAIQYSKVTCGNEAACLEDPRNVELERKSRDQVVNEVVPGKIVAVNGILNDEDRALQLAYQNVDPFNIPGQDAFSSGTKADANVYLMHIPQARNGVSELIGVAYERMLTNLPYGMANFLGYTPHMEEYARLIVDLGDQAYQSLGHSRGTLVQQAAFTIAHNRWDFTNPNLSVRGVGGAATAQVYTSEAIRVLGSSELGDRVRFSYFEHDPVSVSVFSGRNPGSWGPSDLWSIFISTNSMHSCYGTGAPGCGRVEIPVVGGPQPTAPEGVGRLIVYVGGVRQEERP